MKKLFIACTMLAAVSLNAAPTFPEATFPGTDTFPGQERAAADNLSKKVAAKADAAKEAAKTNAAKNLAARKVPVSISAEGMGLFQASGVLLDLNTEKTKAKILLDENASRMIDSIGEGDDEYNMAQFTIEVDLSAFGKGFFSKNTKAAEALRSDTNRGDNEPVLYVYTMPVNPKGKFAQSMGVVRAISIPDARKMLKDNKKVFLPI